MSVEVDITNFNPLKITSVAMTWEIENVWQISFEGISSGVFLLSDHLFHLHVRRYELGIAFYLCRADAQPTVMNVLCKLCMIDHVGNEKLIVEKEVVMGERKEFVLLDTVMINELEAQKTEFIINDKLTVSCNVFSSYRLNIMKQKQPENTNNTSRLETLSSDMEKFFEAQINTDVVLKADNIEYPVHLTVLQARSPELAALITNIDTQQTSNTLLEVHDISASILGDVLFYIYTGKIKKLTPDNVIQIFAAAKRFSLAELKDVCQKFLHTNLTNDNVFEAAILAQENDYLFLRVQIELYIVKNISTIKNSCRWDKFFNEHYKLANDIFASVLLRIQNKDNATEEH